MRGAHKFSDTFRIFFRIFVRVFQTIFRIDLKKNIFGGSFVLQTCRRNQSVSGCPPASSIAKTRKMASDEAMNLSQELILPSSLYFIVSSLSSLHKPPSTQHPLSRCPKYDLIAQPVAQTFRRRTPHGRLCFETFRGFRVLGSVDGGSG